MRWKFLPPPLRAVLLAAAMVTLSGCGQKGGLFLPDEVAAENPADEQYDPVSEDYEYGSEPE